MGDALARHEGRVRVRMEAASKGLRQSTAELRMSQLLGEIDANVEPGPDELAAVLSVRAEGDTEVDMILKLIGESHEEYRAVTGGQRTHPAGQRSNGGFTPGEGGVRCDQRFDLITDCSSNVCALRVRETGTAIAKVAMGVGGMEQARRDHGTRGLQQSENAGGPNRVSEERFPGATETTGEEPHRQVISGPEASHVRVRIASCDEVPVEPDVCLRRRQ